MTAEPTSLKPNTRPNFVLAAMALALGLMMGWLALDLARVLGRNAVPRDYGFLAAMIKRFAFNLRDQASLNALKSMISGSVK